MCVCVCVCFHKTRFSCNYLNDSKNIVMTNFWGHVAGFSVSVVQDKLQSYGTMCPFVVRGVCVRGKAGDGRGFPCACVCLFVWLFFPHFWCGDCVSCVCARMCVRARVCVCVCVFVCLFLCLFACLLVCLHVCSLVVSCYYVFVCLFVFCLVCALSGFLFVLFDCHFVNCLLVKFEYAFLMLCCACLCYHYDLVFLLCFGLFVCVVFVNL